MHIYIDESGSFVPATNPASLCVVAALAVVGPQLRGAPHSSEARSR